GGGSLEGFIGADRRVVRAPTPTDTTANEVNYAVSDSRSSREKTMTTSKETEWMNHPRLRKLVTAVNELTLAERITLVKGLVPAIADELSDTEYERFIDSIRLKGERFHEAQAHPGEGRAERKIPGERDIEGR
ncbi:MAG: hypothetical protein ACJ8AE_00120, partial [Gemmatimonadaceae bacterium]